MKKSVATIGVRVVLVALMLGAMAGCKLFGGSSGGSAAPTAVQGVETPSSISVVSANNAN